MSDIAKDASLLALGIVIGWMYAVYEYTLSLNDGWSRHRGENGGIVWIMEGDDD